MRARIAKGQGHVTWTLTTDEARRLATYLSVYAATHPSPWPGEAADWAHDLIQMANASPAPVGQA